MKQFNHADVVKAKGVSLHFDLITYRVQYILENHAGYATIVLNEAWAFLGTRIEKSEGESAW